VQRVWVVGNSGSGKTTMSRSLATRLAVPHLELDAIYHQADWRPLEPAKFRLEVAQRLAGPAWVVDGNYSVVSDLVLARADTVVWIDISRASVMRQLAGRTLRRGLLRVELWNGNRERLGSMVSRDPEKSIMLWAWRNHDKYARRYAELVSRSGAPRPTVVQLRSRREMDAFVRGADGARYP